VFDHVVAGNDVKTPLETDNGLGLGHIQAVGGEVVPAVAEIVFSQFQ
jgi:hypothetical protein